MIDHLNDTNVFIQIFKGNAAVLNFVQSFDCAIETTVYIETLQGSKGNPEKAIIKRYLAKFPIYHFTPEVSRRAIALIDKYSNSNGLLIADAQIAAACLEYDLTLITYNIKDFHFISGLNVIAPPYPQI